MSANPGSTLPQERIEYLRQQEALYEQMKAKLLDQYAEEFVAFENGAVLDHDRDERALLHRVYQQQGYRDFLIKQVLIQEPHLSVGGAFTMPQEN
ncbi:MAG: hypothetical protein VKJ46_05650 [Leptolyngbyaceae bacterium]|nr:hypothetical protein [Leptolyngbyaceae bacterium]